jgi:hypothetical protein
MEVAVMRIPFSYRQTFRGLWRCEAGGGTRALASLAALLLLGGASAGAGWVYGVAVSLQRMGWGLRTDTNGVRFAIAGTLAAVVWLGLLWVIWRPPQKDRAIGSVDPDESGRGGLIAAAVGTFLVMAIAGVVAEIIARSGFVHGDRSIMHTSVWLLTGGALVALWLPGIRRLEAQRPALDCSVDIRCPTCGYSMAGLTLLRCSECGAAFTIDGLLRAQGFDAAPKNGTPKLG